MKISLCTITFRHHLVSLEDIARWAGANDFQGIELWGAHARNLAYQPQCDADWLAGQGLYVPMVSDYLPLDGDAETLRKKTVDLCRLARHWRRARSAPLPAAAAAGIPRPRSGVSSPRGCTRLPGWPRIST